MKAKLSNDYEVIFGSSLPRRNDWKMHSSGKRECNTFS